MKVEVKILSEGIEYCSVESVFSFDKRFIDDAALIHILENAIKNIKERP